jgi:hypothetical protein
MSKSGDDMVILYVNRDNNGIARWEKMKNGFCIAADISGHLYSAHLKIWHVSCHYKQSLFVTLATLNNSPGTAEMIVNLRTKLNCWIQTESWKQVSFVHL